MTPFHELQNESLTFVEWEKMQLKSLTTEDN